MKLIPKFRISSILVLMACISFFLGMNFVPKQFGTALVDGPNRPPLHATSYGWPNEVITFYTSQDVNPELAALMDPYGKTGMLSKINRQRPYRLFKNLLVFAIVTSTITVGFEYLARRRQRLPKLDGPNRELN